MAARSGGSQGGQRKPDETRPLDQASPGGLLLEETHVDEHRGYAVRGGLGEPACAHDLGERDGPPRIGDRFQDREGLAHCAELDGRRCGDRQVRLSRFHGSRLARLRTNAGVGAFWHARSPRFAHARRTMRRLWGGINAALECDMHRDAPERGCQT